MLFKIDCNCFKHNRLEPSLHAVSLSPLHVNETAMKNADYTQQTFSMCVLVSGLHFLTMNEIKCFSSYVIFRSVCSYGFCFFLGEIFLAEFVKQNISHFFKCVCINISIEVRLTSMENLFR